MKARDRAGQDATAPTLPRLLTTRDVAARLQVSSKTVRRWVDAGDLPVHRLGRQLRISESDLTTFLKLRRQP